MVKIAWHLVIAHDIQEIIFPPWDSRVIFALEHENINLKKSLHDKLNKNEATKQFIRFATYTFPWFFVQSKRDDAMISLKKYCLRINALSAMSNFCNLLLLFWPLLLDDNFFHEQFDKCFQLHSLLKQTLLFMIYLISKISKKSAYISKQSGKGRDK